MALALAIFGVALAALCVWLTVRIVNRREKWAKRTAVVLLWVLLFVYPFSIGPIACIVNHDILPASWKPALVEIYSPIIWAVNHGPQWLQDAAGWYLSIWQT
jgi:hypothetical protein